jgi:hypothetical protein
MKMQTSVLFLALMGFGPTGGQPDAPSWLTDYGQAKQQAAAAQKPLVVVLGTGEKGYNMVVPGGLDSQHNKSLASKYVCVFIDTTTETGKAMRTAFQMPGNVGIVISDVSGRYQAFWHAGTLTNQALAVRLDRYADPNRTYVATETSFERPMQTTAPRERRLFRRSVTTETGTTSSRPRLLGRLRPGTRAGSP